MYQDPFYKKKSEKIDSYQLTIMVTRNCNLNCDYCFTVNNEREENTDRYYIYKHALNDIYRIDEIKEPNIINIEFFGGEPLLQFDTIQYIIENLKLKANLIFCF